MSNAFASFKKYNLILSEDSLTSQYGQSPEAARRLINLIPSRALDLKRKAYAAPFAAAPPNGYWWSFCQDYVFYVGGTPTRKTIAAYSNNIGTFIGTLTGGAFTPLPAGAEVPPLSLTGWRGDPLILYSGGLLFISDGVESSVYDGFNSHPWGMQKQPQPAVLRVVDPAEIGSPAASGPILAVFTGTGLNDLTVQPMADGQVLTVQFLIEIDGSGSTFKWNKDGSPFLENVPITGADQSLSHGVVIKFKSVSGHTPGDQWLISIVGFPCEFFREYVVGEYWFFNKQESMPSNRVRFTPEKPGMYIIEVNLPAFQNVLTGWTAGQADYFRIYASHVDGSTLLYRLVETPDPPGQYNDFSPFYGEPRSLFVPLEPAFRNQRQPPSLIGAVFHNRCALRDPLNRARLWVTGFTEIIEQGGARGNPLETCPGYKNPSLLDQADAEANPVIKGGILNNLSDFDNWIELPDEQHEMRGMLWFQDGLMIGTEKSVKIMWGRNPEDPFKISNTSTYGFGIFGKNSFLLTPHGLVIFTADRRLMLDPVISPSEGDRTSQVIDIGWPKQVQFDETDIQYTNRFQMRHHRFGRERDWLVVIYTSQNAIDGGKAHCLVYDFTSGGWLTFDDVNPTSVGIVLEDGGYQFLVGGGSFDHFANEDRRLKVLSDYTSNANSAYAAAATRLSLPAIGNEIRPKGTYRTALLDLGAPELQKNWAFLRLYLKPRGLALPTVKIWFDPEDVEALPGADGNPGNPDLVLSPPGTNGDAFDFRVLSSHEYLGNLEMRLHRRAIFQFEIPGVIDPTWVDDAFQGIEILFQEKSGFARV